MNATASLLVMLLTPGADMPNAAVLSSEIPAVARPTYYPGPLFDLSPDGKTALTGYNIEGRQHFLRFWSVANGAVLNDLYLGEPNRVLSAKFGPEGKTIAVGLSDQRNGYCVRLINAETGATIRVVTGFQGATEVRGFSTDGTKLTVVDMPLNGKKSFKPTLETIVVATGKRLDSAEATFDRTLATATADGKVRAYLGFNSVIKVSRAGENDLTIPNTQGGGRHSLFLTPDGKQVVAGTHAWADVFDSTTGEKVRSLRVDTQAVTSVAAADGGKLLFVAVTNGSPTNRPGPSIAWVHVWDTTKPELKSVISGFGNDLSSVTPTPDGKRFVAVHGHRWHANKIVLWDTATKKVIRTFDTEAKREAAHTVVSPDAGWVAYFVVGKDTSTLSVWNTDTGKLAEEVSKAAGPTGGSIAFTPDSKRLITASLNEYAEWDLTTGKREAGWKQKPAPLFGHLGVGSITPLPGGKGMICVVATAKRRQSYGVSLMTETKDWPLGEFWDYASVAAVSADGRNVALIGGNWRDGANYLLRLNDDGSPELEPNPQPGGAKKMVPAWRMWPTDGFSSIIAFSPDGKRLYTGGRCAAVKVWDVATHELQATLYAVPAAKADDPSSDWVAFTPAGHFAASTHGEQVLRFRDSSFAAWAGLRPSTGSVPAAELPGFRDSVKVRAALLEK